VVDRRPSIKKDKLAATAFPLPVLACPALTPDFLLMNDFLVHTGYLHFTYPVMQAETMAAASKFCDLDLSNIPAKTQLPDLINDFYNAAFGSRSNL